MDEEQEIRFQNLEDKISDEREKISDELEERFENLERRVIQNNNDLRGVAALFFFTAILVGLGFSLFPSAMIAGVLAFIFVAFTSIKARR